MGSFITVPGVGTPPLQSWSNGDGGIWLSSIPPTSAPDIAVYYFEHGIRPDDEFSWKILFDQGADLLDELIKLGDVAEVRSNIIRTFQNETEIRNKVLELSDYFDRSQPWGHYCQRGAVIP